MNSFCGILDIRNTSLDFEKLKNMGTALTARQTGKSAEAVLDKGVGIFGTDGFFSKNTPVGELYITLDSASIETPVSIGNIADTYLNLGYDTPTALNGHFALLVFDRKKRELLLATDPLGAKPIFLCNDGDKIAVSTSIASLLRYSPSCAEVDKAAVLELVRAPDGDVRATDIYKNISELSGGHFMIFSGLGAQILKYASNKEPIFSPPPHEFPKLAPDKSANLKKCAEDMTAALGYPSFDAYTPEYISAIRAAAQDKKEVFIAAKRHRLFASYHYRKLYALGGFFGVNVYPTDTDEDTHLKKSLLLEREKKLSDVAAAILSNEHSHTRRLFGRSLETIVSKESDVSAKIGIWGKIIGLERWLETYPIAPI